MGNKKWIVKLLILFCLGLSVSFVTVVGYEAQAKGMASYRGAAVEKIIVIKDINKQIFKNEKFILPKTVTARMSSGKNKELPVKWNKSIVNTSHTGKYVFTGDVSGYPKKVVLNLLIKESSSADNLNIVSVEDINKEILKNDIFSLPNSVVANLKNGESREFPVIWNTKSVNCTKAGKYVFTGSVAGYSKKVILNLTIKEITSVNNYDIVMEADKDPEMPDTLQATLNDGSSMEVKVIWDTQNPSVQEPGIYVYSGKVQGYDGKVSGTVDKKLPEKVKSIIGSVIRPGMTDYEKELALHDYLVLQTVFDKTISLHSDNLADYDLIVNGRGNSYGMAFKRLCEAAGLECLIVTGQVLVDDQWHNSSWDLVKLEGAYYHVDSLWDNPNDIGSPKKISYNYFNLDDTKMSRDHKWDIQTYPKADSAKFWYYAKVETEINNKVDTILAAVLKPGMSEYDKELALHNYLIENTAYNKGDQDYRGSDVSDYDLIVKGKGSEYTKAFNRMLKAAGIESKIITGEKKDDTGWYPSIWNLVKLDGNYYHVDIILDAVTTTDGGSYITYKYLNLTDNEIKPDHRWNAADYPVCSSEQYSINFIRNNEVNSKVNQIIAQLIKPGMTDVQKEIAIHDYIVENTIYDSDTLEVSNKKSSFIDSDTNTAYAALIKGKSMCVGYAEAINILLNTVGIEAKVIYGDTRNQNGVWSGHAWNLVKLDGEYYQLDATWDDPVMDNGGQVLMHFYFNLTDSAMSADHRWNRNDYPAALGVKYGPQNLSLIDKDEEGNEYKIFTNTNDLYNYLISLAASHKDKATFKIVNYSDDYKNVFQRVVNESAARGCSVGYYTDNYGSRYCTIKFTY